MKNITPPGYSSVQAAVQIVQNMVQCGMDGAAYERECSNLHGFMHEHAMAETRQQYLSVYEERTQAQAHQTFEEWVLDDESENEPYALAYWAATSAFFRKVYQAAAAAA